tara:strand:- start:198 stop:401 length:204 start_codon:yes stop_codon:yes gene_type:complete
MYIVILSDTMDATKEHKMEKHGDQIEVTEREASNKPRSPHGVRIVLAVSLVLAVIVMSLVWIIPALD